jgi:hypothetical protein
MTEQILCETREILQIVHIRLVWGTVSSAALAIGMLGHTGKSLGISVSSGEHGTNR